MSAVDRYKPKPSPPWKVCSVCGIAAPDVRGEPLKCVDAKRCAATRMQPILKQDVLKPASDPYVPDPPARDFKGEKPPAGTWHDFVGGWHWRCDSCGCESLLDFASKAEALADLGEHAKGEPCGPRAGGRS